MPRGSKKPQAGTRLPSLRGAFVVDEIHGKPRIRRWPRPRGINRNPTNAYWSRWLKAITLLYRWQPATVQAQLQEATRDTPWMPRDPFISAARGRAWSITFDDGRTYYPMPTQAAVSESLDAIGQLEGQLLARSANLWVPIAPGSTPGDVLTWQAADEVPAWAPAGGGGGGSLDAWSPLTPPDVAGSLDDEFDTTEAGVPTGWTAWDNPATMAVAVDGAGLEIQQTGTPGDDWSGIYKTDPTGDLTVWSRIQMVASRTSVCHAGILFLEDPTDSTADLADFGFSMRATRMRAHVALWNSYQSHASTPFAPALADTWNTGLFMRVRRDGTDYAFDYSTDGVSWYQAWTGTLPFTPTAIGLGISNQQSSWVQSVRAPFFRSVAGTPALTDLMHGARV